MSTETISIADLEEHFSLDVPCGGNKWPVKRSCPDQSPAVMVRRRCCADDQRGPEIFKCITCFTEWATGSPRTFPGASFCIYCKSIKPISWWYRPL